MRASVASPSFDDKIQHADCLSPTGYSTDHQDAGCTPEPRRPAQARLLVRLALRCTIRCLSRLTMLVSTGSTTTCSFAGPHSRPGRCINRGTSAHRLTAIPGAPRTREAGLAWSDRIRRFGGIPWDVSLSRRHRRSSAPGRCRTPDRASPIGKARSHLAGTAGVEPVFSRLTAERSAIELHAKENWWIGTDSNYRSVGLQPTALPAELPIRNGKI